MKCIYLKTKGRPRVEDCVKYRIAVLVRGLETDAGDGSGCVRGVEGDRHSRVVFVGEWTQL